MFFMRFALILFIFTTNIFISSLEKWRQKLIINPNKNNLTSEKVETVRDTHRKGHVRQASGMKIYDNFCGFATSAVENERVCKK